MGVLAQRACHCARGDALQRVTATRRGRLTVQRIAAGSAARDDPVGARARAPAPAGGRAPARATRRAARARSAATGTRSARRAALSAARAARAVAVHARRGLQGITRGLQCAPPSCARLCKRGAAHTVTWPLCSARSCLGQCANTIAFRDRPYRHSPDRSHVWVATPSAPLPGAPPGPHPARERRQRGAGGQLRRGRPLQVLHHALACAHALLRAS